MMSNTIMLDRHTLRTCEAGQARKNRAGKYLGVVIEEVRVGENGRHAANRGVGYNEVSVNNTGGNLGNGVLVGGKSLAELMSAANKVLKPNFR